LQSNAAVRTSAFPECGSGDPGDQAWGSIKYLRPFPFIQSSFLCSPMWTVTYSATKRVSSSL
jgi:hypothetical protein